MSDHNFHSKDPETGDWMVYCKNKRDSFDTALWRQGKVARGVCPCCNQNIEIEKRTEKQKASIALGIQKTL